MSNEQQKPKRGKDATRTPRQKDYLSRLESSQGKRVVVDLDGEGRGQLEDLLAQGYATSQADVVRRALREAHAREKKKSTA